MRPGRWRGGLLAVAIAAAGMPAAADTPPAPGAAQPPPPPSFSLDLTETPAQQVTLTVAAPASVPIRIIHNGGPATGVSLDLGVFRTEQGVTLPVTFTLGADTGKGVTHLDNQTINQPVLPINLLVPAFPAGGTFSGTLLLSAPTGTGGALQTTSWRFNLSSAADVRPATLVLDQTTANLTAARPWCLLFVPAWCFGGQTPTVTVHLRDKTGAFPLNGVLARFDGGLVGPGAGFDPTKHVDAVFNDAKDTDLFATPPAGARVVEPHEQATVTLAFHDLPPGEYTFPVRFTAANSADDTTQLLTVSVKLRNNVLGAILVLILAAAMSFLATRVVAMLRQRAAFLQQLAGLRPAWLADEAPILPVIWLRAALRQAEELSRRHWMSGQDQISARLTAASATLGVLDRVRQVRDQIGGITDLQVRRRAEWALGRITRQIAAGPLADAEVTRLKGLLDALVAWADPANAAQQEHLYWADLRPSIVARCAEVQPGDLPQAAQASAADLLKALRDALQTEPADLGAKNTVEAAFARLSIMWELRTHPEPLAALLALPNWPRAPIDRVYQVVDDFWWVTLCRLQPGDLLVDGPAEPVHAFDPVTFRAHATDPALSGCYMFNNKLTWHWTIKLQTKLPHLANSGMSRTVPLTAVSSEPRIAQYSPDTGEFSASVHVTYQGHDGPTVEALQPVRIRRSEDFRIWDFFETADLLATGVALLTSVISGVALYALAPSFGSLTNYLALFTWGASLDQGKNFLQSLAAYSSPAPTQQH